MSAAAASSRQCHERALEAGGEGVRELRQRWVARARRPRVELRHAAALAEHAALHRRDLASVPALCERFGLTFGA
jgi:hypothetical protein